MVGLVRRIYLRQFAPLRSEPNPQNLIEYSPRVRLVDDLDRRTSQGTQIGFDQPLLGIAESPSASHASS